MLKTRNELKDRIAQLDEARREATGPGCGCYCTAPILTAGGENFRWEPKPSKRIGERLKADGTLVEAMQDGKPGIKIPLGVHGRSFLAIDVESGAVVCGACATKKGGAS